MSSQNACARKVRYSRAEAKRQSKLRNTANGRQGSYYHCDVCYGYHLTSLPPNFINPNIWKLIRSER